MDQIYLITRIADGKIEPVGLCRPEDILYFCSKDFKEHYGNSAGYICKDDNGIDMCGLHMEIHCKSVVDVEEHQHAHYSFKAMDIYKVDKEDSNV